jgi:hypothetical protein
MITCSAHGGHSGLQNLCSGLHNNACTQLISPKRARSYLLQLSRLCCRVWASQAPADASQSLGQAVPHTYKHFLWAATNNQNSRNVG